MIPSNQSVSLSRYSQAVKAYGATNANIQALGDLRQPLVVPADSVEIGISGDTTAIAQNNVIKSASSSDEIKSNGYHGLLKQLNNRKAPKAILYQGDRLEPASDRTSFQNLLRGKFNSIRQEEAILSEASSSNTSTIAVMRSINTLEQSVQEFTAVRDKLVNAWHEVFNLAM